MVRKFRVVQEW